MGRKGNNLVKANSLPARIERQIDKLVESYKEKETFHRFKMFAEAVYKTLREHPTLIPLVHSSKYRLKNSEHLRNKLLRKAKEATSKGKTFKINEKNLFNKIDDLAGVRLLHLHTQQMTEINIALLQIFKEENYKLVTGPIANTWDNEYRAFFEGLSMQISERETMYTSVHYVIGSNNKYKTKCEIQVRTLMEEVWGEVSHKINYPDQISSICCQEQIKVLARATSSCTRLVDSIFKSHLEHSVGRNKKAVTK